MKKQPEATDKTRNTFIDVFCELYSQKPIEKISVQQIANKAGYNRSTFYQYFSDIYEMATYIENDVLEYIKEALQSDTAKNRPTAESIMLLFENKGTYLAALLGDYGSMRFLERMKQEIPLIADTSILEKEWNLPKDSKITPYIFEFHISTSLSLFRFWFRRQKDLPPDELFSLIHNLYTGGILSIAGHTD